MQTGLHSMMCTTKKYSDYAWINLETIKQLKGEDMEYLAFLYSSLFKTSSYLLFCWLFYFLDFLEFSDFPDFPEFFGFLPKLKLAINGV